MLEQALRREIFNVHVENLCWFVHVNIKSASRRENMTNSV